MDPVSIQPTGAFGFSGRVEVPAIEGIEVALFSKPIIGATAYYEYDRSTYTLADGTFSFTDLPDDHEFKVRFRDSSAEWSETWNCGPGSSQIGPKVMDSAPSFRVGSPGFTVRLRGTGSLTGVVRSSSGSTAPGVRMRIYGNGWNGGYSLLDVVDSGAGGVYRVANLAPGTYQVELYDLSQQNLPELRATTWAVSNLSTTTADFMLDKAVTFSGTVRRSLDGAGVPGVIVTVKREDPITHAWNWSFATSTWTGGDGRWYVGGLTEGRYKIEFHVYEDESSAEVSEYYHDAPTLEEATAIDAGPGEDITIDETLATGGTVTGECRNGLTGELYEFLWVEVYRLDERSGTWSSYSGTSSTNAGRYSVSMLPSGTYRLSAQTSSAWPPVRTGYHPDAMTLESAGDITIVGGQTTVADVTLYPIEQIAGSITSTLSGKKIEHAELSLWSQNDGGTWSVVATEAPQFDDDYVFDGVLPGVYRLTATDTLDRYYDRGHPGGQTVDDAEDIVVTRGLRVRHDVTLEPILGVVRGTVRNSVTGAPVPGAVVGYEAYNGYVDLGPVVPARMVIADGDGKYEFQYESEELAFRVWDSAGAYVPTEFGRPWWNRVRVNPGETTVADFAIDPRGRYTMRVSDAETGEPASGVLVSYDSPHTGMRGSALTGVDGAMSTSLLDPSWYWFTISDSGDRYQTLIYNNEYGVKIEPGQTLDLTATVVPNHYTTALALTAPGEARLGSTLSVTANLTKSAGALVAGRNDVSLWRSPDDGSTWLKAATASDAGTPGVYRAAITLDDAVMIQMRCAGDRFFSTSASGSFTVIPMTSATPCPVEGSDRIATAVAASNKAFPTGAATVVIATGFNWPDALGGSALAGALDAPVLLTRQDVLPAELSAEIVRLKATKVIVLGGTSAVSQSVVNQAAAIAGVSVERIAGGNRYETANKVAAKTIAVLGSAYDGRAFVATGMNFPDALGASPLAAAKGWPIYLANPYKGDNAELVSVMKAARVTRVVALGGTNVVASSVESELRRVLGDANVTRVAGTSRYDTAVKIASYGISNAGLHWNGVAIATGQNFPDALAGGVLQARSGSVLLLTPSTSLDKNVAATLTKNKTAVTRVTFLGSTSALSATVRAKVLNALK